MNFGPRLALSAVSLVAYWLLPTTLPLVWGAYLVVLVLLFGLRDSLSPLIMLVVLSLLLLPLSLYSTKISLSFLKLWLTPIVPITFLFPDLSRGYGGVRSGVETLRFRPLLSLSALSTFLGNGAFQVAHGLSVLLFGQARTFTTKSILFSPTFSIPLLWLLLGIGLRVVHQSGFDKLSTALSWIWAPLLCVMFHHFSLHHIRYYLTRAGVGLIMCSVFGFLIYHVNPSIEHPIMAFLPAISSIHQARLPGTTDEFALGGFFFHRLKFAHLSLMLLPTLWFFSSRKVASLSTILVISAIALSHAAWAGAVLIGLTTIHLVLALWKRPPLHLLVSATLLSTVSLGIFFHQDKTLPQSLVAKSPSLQTRALMAESAINLIESTPSGLGHGAYKSWSLEHYPKNLDNRQLPRTLPHNLGLASLVETGVIGWSLIVGLLTYLLSFSFKVLSGSFAASSEHRLLALLIASATLSLIGLGMLHDPLYHKPVAFGWMTVLGLAHALRRNYSI